MNPIYLRQRYVENPQIRTAIERTRRADQALLLDMYDLHFGPWDTLAENHPFWGPTEWPEGAGFYPTDLTKAEFADYLAAHPDQKEALTSGYTGVRRQGDPPAAGPSRAAYNEGVEPAATPSGRATGRERG